MLIDHIYVAPDEILGLASTPQGWKLSLRWSWTDLPLLLDLPPLLLLRWDHLDREGTGMQCRKVGWSYRARSRSDGVLTLRLTLPATSCAAATATPSRGDRQCDGA